MGRGLMSTAAPPIITRSVGRGRLTRKERQNLVTGLLFISPWIVGFLAFLVYPIIYTLRISFTEYTGFGEPRWIGLDNYRMLMQDDLFWISLYNTLRSEERRVGKECKAPRWTSR